MAKKRPRVHPARNSGSAVITSKAEPGYWRQRLFKNTFTYRGKRCKVAHWSVKIQHQGHRKTFSLRETDPALAARQACELYKAIVTDGWDKVLSTNGQVDQKDQSAVHNAGSKGGLDQKYWSQRLVHRKYAETFHPRDAANEFSVRIEHSGTSRFFPLGTANRRMACARAARIYRAIVEDGWPAAKKLFPRELSLAFRWADSPLAWTYTTVRTQPTLFRSLSGSVDSRAATFNVAIVESDNGLRNVLAWCVNQEEGCRCVGAFASGAEALQELRRRPAHLLLVSENLGDQPGAGCLKQWSALAPRAAGLVYSVYEDAEELFKSSPGGAASYLFRRTAPTRLLEPLAEARKQRDFTREKMANSVRQFFAATLLALPFGGPSHELLNSLTRREHEILALLSKGHPDKEIADLLRISTWTVHGHLKKIFEKLKAHNRTDAVVKYLNK